MKLEAHPLVVAVALGLLGPGALVEEDEQDPEAPCSGCDLEGRNSVAEWEPGEAPDPDEFHRVEIEWLKLERG